MNDPYGILGVSQTASDADIKKAYRELVKKYHPDNYVNNPLADLAQEKMKQINEAYSTIVRQRQSGTSGNQQTGSTGRQQSGTYSGSGTHGSGSMNDIRSAINIGDLARAEQLLARITDRGAEWNFLMGSIYYKKGWLDEARGYFQRAVSMDPANQEYAQAYAYCRNGSYPYRQSYGTPSNLDTDMCDICTAMMCANMLCNCR